ncbi:MAG: galactose mutarotase, partial [Bacteroidales bacterium]|nr:galactose mutarotase [Bacteroidales bacterium]
PDRDGKFEDIVLGHDHINKYVHYGTTERFLGATIGRYGNRIAGGSFTLDGVTYSLPVNNGPNSLHGGVKGFDMLVWDVCHVEGQVIEFLLVSPDGDQGYPGTLTVHMTYQLTDDNELVVTHKATTDKNTVVNLTHHSFFNLHGAGNGTINDHVMMLNASNYIPVDATLIPYGSIALVEGTPMDFRLPTVIGERVDSDFEQLVFGRGYDHSWVIDRTTADQPELAAVVYEPVLGRTLEVWTTEPGIQFYGGNFFDGALKGKEGKSYDFRASFALETQHYPDSPNHPDFPSTVLEPGQQYFHQCVYKFGVK